MKSDQKEMSVYKPVLFSICVSLLSLATIHEPVKADQWKPNLIIMPSIDYAEAGFPCDGVIGLSRSLITAGVPSVIVSLWSVPDAPTASLMTQFYQNLQQNPDKAQALRQAMLTTMATHPNPKDWAAFTLIGEAQ